jgi:hypothetical protein
MNRTKWILAIVTVLLIGSAAVVLARYQSIQRLGDPGVKTRPIAGSRNLEVVLPENVLDFTSEWMPQSEIVTNVLPRDTSYGQRRYSLADKFYVQANVVLMGTDRASLHKPQFCLTGAGWTITKTEVVPIPIEKPVPYDLDVIKLTATTTIKEGGREQPVSGIYVYWYVSHDSLSANPTGSDRMWSMARNLVTTGELERWAYITFFAPCNPGQEEEAYARVKKLIAAAVPEFQIPHGTKAASSQKP